MCTSITDRQKQNTGFYSFTCLGYDFQRIIIQIHYEVFVNIEVSPLFETMPVN